MIPIQIKRGDIYYIEKAPSNCGSEQRGDRPGIIVSNDTGNKFSPVVEIVYLTTKLKKNSLPTHIPINAERPSLALCEQIHSISKDRIGEYMGHITEDEQRNIDKALKTSLALEQTEGARNMNEIIPVNYDNERPTVLGRDLHEFLEVKTAYKDWFPRMCEYGFAEGVEFCSFLSETSKVGGRPAQDHQLTIEMAKEISMLQRNEKGKRARQYFIQLENAWNTPEQIMARALKMADNQIKSLSAANSKLTVENTIMQPKAEYFDELVDRNLLTGIRETAKELKVKEKEFVAFLLEHKYLYRDKKGKLMPYAGKGDGLFEIKETYNEKTEWKGTQTLITPKGRETFRLLLS